MVSLPGADDRNEEDQSRTFARKAIMTFNLSGEIDTALVVANVFDLPESRAMYVTYTNVTAHVLNAYGYQLPPNCVIVDSEGKIAMPWDIVYADVGSEVATLRVIECTEGLDTSSLPTHEAIRSGGIDYLQDRPNALHPLPDAPFSTVWSLRAAHVHSFRLERDFARREELCLCYGCRAVYYGEE